MIWLWNEFTKKTLIERIHWRNHRIYGHEFTKIKNPEKAMRRDVIENINETKGYNIQIEPRKRNNSETQVGEIIHFEIVFFFSPQLNRAIV